MSSLSQAQLRNRVAYAIRLLQGSIRWKPGKDIAHLRTRQAYGHLPSTATIEDYEAIIKHIVSGKTTDVYVYVWQTDIMYPTLVSSYEQKQWLVMFSLDGVMETAFPPSDPDSYLQDSRFRFVGTVKDVLS